MQSPLYSYCTRESVWSLLSSDTNADGGPQLLYDHQVGVAVVFITAPPISISVDVF